MMTKAIPIVATMILLSAGCSRSKPVPTTQHDLPLGALAVGTRGSTISTTVSVPPRIVNTPQLILVVQGTSFWYTSTTPPEEELAMLPLRLDLRVREGSGTNVLFQGELCPTNHFDGASWKKPYAAAFRIRDVSPLLFAQDQPPTTNYVLGTFHHGRDADASQDRRLAPGRSYTIDLTVVEAATANYTIEAWLSCHAMGAQAWADAIKRNNSEQSTAR